MYANIYIENNITEFLVTHCNLHQSNEKTVVKTEFIRGMYTLENGFISFTVLGSFVKCQDSKNK